MKKERLDTLLVERGYFSSRERAKRAIMAGDVFVAGQREDKAGTKVDAEADIVVKGDPIPYVSRGGLKLEKAIPEFGISLQDKICIDIGASTGGFTDCMIQNGAAKVYSIDVGYGQLAWSLRTNPKVVSMERTNFRHLKKGDLPDYASFAGCDVSFISLSKILPAACELLEEGAQMVCLINPQFEAGKEKVGKKGVVRDPKVHKEVIRACLGYAKDSGFDVLGLSFSPITGPKGNVEFLMYLKKGKSNENNDERLDALVEEVVEDAHKHFSDSSESKEGE